MSLLDDDVAALFADPLFSVKVQRGAATVRGYFDRAESMIPLEGANVIVREPSLLIPAGSLPGLTVGQALTVDGRATKVTRILDEDDGRTTRVMCAEGA